MTKKIIHLFLLFLLLGCQQTLFDGDRIANDNLFYLDYRMMNKTESHTFSLHQNDQLKITIENHTGQISMYIKKENGEVIYQGNDLPTCEFIVGIHEEGIYHIEITGKKAQGKIEIIVK